MYRSNTPRPAPLGRYRANAKRAAMVQSRIKMLGKMETLSEILDDPSLRFNFPDPESLSSPVTRPTLT